MIQTMGSGLKTGRRIFYHKVEKVEEGKRNRNLPMTGGKQRRERPQRRER
jgi:hypothetical protein